MKLLQREERLEKVSKKKAELQDRFNFLNFDDAEGLSRIFREVRKKYLMSSIGHQELRRFWKNYLRIFFLFFYFILTFSPQRSNLKKQIF